jgi:hypothetical protein
LITSWSCALDAAAAAAESAHANKVVSAAELKDLLRGLHVERAWLGRFERDSFASFP